MDDIRGAKDDGRRAPSDGKCSLCLWQGELTTVNVVDMSLHSDTLFLFRVNQYLLFLLNAAFLARSNKYQFYILLFDKTAVRTHKLSHSR
jgi:hypothetical protein